MTFEEMMTSAHEHMVRQGFWNSANLGEKLALIHGEVSETMEHYRKGTDAKASAKIPAFTNEEEELADIVLRVMDLAEHRGVRLTEAMEAKYAYNLGRPYMHGRQF
jgi:NTP pyrophosphatase (non-canonical NTP hydrolase)